MVGVTARWKGGHFGFASAQGSSQNGQGYRLPTGSSPVKQPSIWRIALVVAGFVGLRQTNVTTSAGDTLGGMTVQPGETEDHSLYRGPLYCKTTLFMRGWGNLRDIPGLVIYVDGNIYIDAGVTRLDGTYAARPTSAGRDYLHLRHAG